jgi:hypothetical protein
MRAFAALVLVPKASMDEDYLLRTRENEIGPARNIVAMQAESTPEFVHKLADQKLWFHPSTFNVAHVF